MAEQRVRRIAEETNEARGACGSRERHCFHFVGHLKTKHGPYAPAQALNSTVYRCCFCGALEDGEFNRLPADAPIEVAS